jgi:putative transposase
VLAYVASNPVEAQLVDRAEDWPWNSYAVITGARSAPRWLDVERALSFLGRDEGAARQRYAKLVDEADKLASVFDL